MFNYTDSGRESRLSSDWAASQSAVGDYLAEELRYVRESAGTMTPSSDSLMTPATSLLDNDGRYLMRMGDDVVTPGDYFNTPAHDLRQQLHPLSDEVTQQYVDMKPRHAVVTGHCILVTVLNLPVQYFI